MTSVTDCPVHLEATPDRPLSRWLWPVNRVLGIVRASRGSAATDPVAPGGATVAPRPGSWQHDDRD
jgi:hypothetical protein